MTRDQLLIFLLLTAAMAVFLWGRWRHDMAAAAALLAFVLAGLVLTAEAFAECHPAGIMVACVLVLSSALQASGAVDAPAPTSLIPVPTSLTRG